MAAWKSWEETFPSFRTTRLPVNPNIRSIISAETKVDTSSEIVRFAVKPSKLFVFDGSSEERIRI
ncbi:MAG: hypothetical protein ACLR2E_01775 [Lachnospiraceae bacterium]